MMIVVDLYGEGSQEMDRVSGLDGRMDDVPIIAPFGNGLEPDMEESNLCVIHFAR